MVIVFPHSGEADGGQTNNWGRSYPHGGIYNTETDTWSTLPEPARDDGFPIAGVLGPDAAAYRNEHGAVLDTAHLSWITIPNLPTTGGEVFNRTIVAAGSDLFIFGGEVWTDTSGSLLSDAYLWRPSR